MEPKQYRDWSLELGRMQPKRRLELGDTPQTPLELWLAYVAFAVGAVCVAAVAIAR